VIDICNLRPRTIYDITLPLRESSHAYSNRERGVIRLRFSLDWISSRDAVLSYLPFKQFKNKSIVTVKCEDKKSFRNVAITVHGQHLPGRFSNSSFQAMLREWKLYTIMSPFLIKQELTDLIFWVYPIVSLLSFIGWMHSVYLNTLTLLPTY